MNACKHLFFTLLFLPGFVLLSGCTKDGIYGYNIIRIKYYNDDNSGQTPVDAPTDSIAAKAYAIRMYYYGVITTTNNGYPYDYPQYIPSRAPWRYDIWSLTDFDATHPALASLQDYFNWLGGPGNYMVTTLPQYVSALNLLFSSQKVGDTASASAWFLLMKAPAALGRRQFVINVLYTDSTSTFDTITANLY